MNTRVFNGAAVRRFGSGAIAFLALAVLASPVNLFAQDSDHDFDHDNGFGYGHSEFRGFVPGSIVLSGTVYVGKADTVIPGEVLPPGCLNTGTVTKSDRSHRECSAAARRSNENRDHDRCDRDLWLCQR